MVETCLPAFFLERFHPQRPHELSDSDRRKISMCILLFRMAVKILLESIVQVDFVCQPWVDGSPVCCLALLVVSLLDDAQPFVSFHV